MGFTPFDPQNGRICGDLDRFMRSGLLDGAKRFSIFEFDQYCLATGAMELALICHNIVLAMQASLERRCTTDRARFENGAARIATLDPMATLGRGFAIVQQASGKRAVINSSRKVKSGHRLAISVADGAFWAEVS